MKLIDMHCDTLWKLMDLDKKGDLMENACSISIPYMKKARSKAQFFACFTYIKDYESNGGYDKAYEHVFEMIAYMNFNWLRMMGRYPWPVHMRRWRITQQKEGYPHS